MAANKHSTLPNNIEYASIRQHRVNLEEDAQTRWDHVMDEYMDELEETRKILDIFIDELVPHPIFRHIAIWICSFLIFLKLFPHSDELTGIAKKIKQPAGDLGLMHIAYEITSFCTSILIHDPYIFGTTINLRTMDWSMPFDLRHLTAKIHFVDNNNEIQYTSIQFIGAVGVVTALKPNEFSIVVNFRNSAYNNVDESSYITLRTIWGFICNWCMILVGGWTVTSLVRYICEHANTYDEAVQMAKSKWLIAPTFITITGTQLNEGVILTRDRLKCVDENVVNDGEQYIVQCNCDHWNVGELNDYSDIYDSKERHEMAQQMLPPLLDRSENDRNSNASIDIIDGEYKDMNTKLTDIQYHFISKCWRFLSIEPIRNEETVYSNIIIPKYNLMITGKTTSEFEAISAKEFRDMFYMTSSNMASSEQKKTE